MFIAICKKTYTPHINKKRPRQKKVTDRLQDDDDVHDVHNHCQ